MQHMREIYQLVFRTAKFYAAVNSAGDLQHSVLPANTPDGAVAALKLKGTPKT
jgi:hypothetical protein